MAKGQMRSNKEARKPKKEKAAPKVETPFGSQIKQATATTNPGKAKKGA
ncbi:hypothetical protein [Mesorhizobium sp. CAU 1732]